MDRRFLLLGALSAFAAVAAGAFGAHALREHLSSEMLGVFETGARYQMYHALGMLLVAALGPRGADRLISAGGWLFVLGTLLFSGSLYLLALTGTPWLGAVTPVGGFAFLAGWLCLVAAGYRTKQG